MKVTAAEFARHLGIAQATLSYHLKKGTLGDAAKQIEGGRWAIDLETGTVNYKRNTQGGGEVRKKAHQQRSIKAIKKSLEAERGEEVQTSLDLPGYIDDLTGAKTKRENYLAEKARLEYEEQIGTLVLADAVQKSLFKATREMRDSLMNIPGKLAPELASMDDVFSITKFLENSVRQSLMDLDNALGDKYGR